MSEHTKERWRADGPFVELTTGDPIAECFDAADARRIVACVNALAGIPTEDIQKDVDVGGYDAIVKCHQAHIKMVEKQRDRLLDALKLLDKRLRECSAAPISAAEAYDSFYQEEVADAIAEVEAANG